MAVSESDQANSDSTPTTSNHDSPKSTSSLGSPESAPVTSDHDSPTSTSSLGSPERATSIHNSPKSISSLASPESPPNLNSPEVVTIDDSDQDFSESMPSHDFVKSTQNLDSKRTPNKGSPKRTQTHDTITNQDSPESLPSQRYTLTPNQSPSKPTQMQDSPESPQSQNSTSITNQNPSKPTQIKDSAESQKSQNSTSATNQNPYKPTQMPDSPKLSQTQDSPKPTQTQDSIEPTLNHDSSKLDDIHVESTVKPSSSPVDNKSNETFYAPSESGIASNSQTQCALTGNLRQSEVDEVFKADQLQQLSTNALPRHTPGSPPSFIQHDVKSFDIHCCSACGDTFALKASLNFHTDRRSVLIKFPCETCKSTCIFYNRCNLLLHVRNHTDKNEKADISRAAVSILPRVFMDGIHNEFVSTLDDELNTIEDSDDPRPGEMVECSLSEFDDSVSDMQSDAEETDISFAKVKCLDCNEEFDTIKDRKDHLTNGDKMPVLLSQCTKCGLFCPSKCSLKAHQRIHLQISPYICPECGESPDPHWTNFLHHVNYVCFHNSRGVGYKCPVCKRFSPTNESLMKHMELHTEKYAKCSECPRAYNSADAFKQHNVTFHDGGQVRYTMIYKCSLCDIVFVNGEQMKSHRGSHLKQVCEYVFNCMQCGKPLESKSLLLEHIRFNHPKMYKQSIQNEPTPTKTTAPVNQYRGTVECLLCMSTFYSQQGYSVHVSRVHLNVNEPCSCCTKILPNRREMVRHGKAHLEEKAVVCLLCNNKKFPSLKELDKHLDNHVSKLKFCSFCPICDRLFLDLPASLNHLRTEHFLPVKSVKRSHNGNVPSTIQDTVCYFCRRSFENYVELQNHLKETHNVSDQYLEKSSAPKKHEQPLKRKRLAGNYYCAKSDCEFVSSSKEGFKKHILTHKTNRSTFQCQDCGLCFVVQPALERHLQIMHEIEDTEKYIADEGTNYKPEVNAAEVARRSALECGVCFTTFPNETSLKTHMRSHGMAFIQANKSGAL